MYVTKCLMNFSQMPQAILMQIIVKDFLNYMPTNLKAHVLHITVLLTENVN